MELTELILSITAALLGGTNIFQFIWWRSERQKRQAEADMACLDAKQKQLDINQDAYEDLVNRLNKYQHDYFDLGEQMQEQTRLFLEKVNAKCNEIAELKSKLIYFKGLRCYKSDCSMRVIINPKDERYNHDDETEQTRAEERQ